jgi:hypothetical protein
MKNDAADGRNRPGEVASFHVQTMLPAVRLSRMRVGIFYGEAFGYRCGIEIPVGRNQRHRPEAGLLVALVQIECGGQLYSVVRPVPMLACRAHRVIEQGGSQIDDEIAVSEMPSEMPKYRAGLGGGKVAAVLSAGDRGSDLNGGDAGDIERVSRFSVDQRAYPAAADLDHMTFDEGAGVEEVIGHLSGDRG